MEVSGQCHIWAALPPGKNPGANRFGGWVGAKGDTDVLEARKFLTHVCIAVFCFRGRTAG